MPPSTLEAQRVRGNKLIRPDTATHDAIVKAQKARVISSFKLCIDVRGSVGSVTMLKSSGFDVYDRAIQAEIKQTWAYAPFEVNGVRVPVCTAVTFIYAP